MSTISFNPARATPHLPVVQDLRKTSSINYSSLIDRSSLKQAESVRPIDLSSQVKRLTGIWAYFLYLFGYALCVYDQDAHQHYYLKCKDVMARLFDTSPKTFRLADSKKLHRLLWETLNPVVGEKILAQQITELFQSFCNAEFIVKLTTAKDAGQAEDLAEKQFEKLKTRHLQVLTFKSQNLLKTLKPGDIFFKKMPHDTKHIVVLGQWLIKPLLFGTTEREAYKYSHVAIYLGNGKIAEAVPDSGGCDVRIIDIHDKRFSIEDCPNSQYLVSRFTDPTLASTAAKVAEKVAEQVIGCKKTTFRYTKIQAIRSVWHPSFFGPFARYRYLKQYIDDHRNELPKEFTALKSFFCSYFVAYSFQTAESRTVIPAILGTKDVPPKGFTAFGSAIFRGIWARIRRYQTWEEMGQRIQLKFDAKRLTPQDFRNFIVGHRKLFQDVCVIRKAVD